SAPFAVEPRGFARALLRHQESRGAAGCSCSMSSWLLRRGCALRLRQTLLDEIGNAQSAGLGKMLTQAKVEKPSQDVALILAEERLRFEGLAHLLEKHGHEQAFEALSRMVDSARVARSGVLRQEHWIDRRRHDWDRTADGVHIFSHLT